MTQDTRDGAGDCPECGSATTEKGITTASGGGVTWDSCINCEWEEYHE